MTEQTSSVVSIPTLSGESATIAATERARPLSALCDGKGAVYRRSRR
jgi:hypothetical protein